MAKHLWWGVFFLMAVLLFDRVVFAVDMTLFDFNDVPTSSKQHSNNFTAIENYMEGLYGSDISVSQKTTAVQSVGKKAPQTYLGNSDMDLSGALSPSLTSPDAFLKNGRGKNSGLVLNFENSPVNSFAVDWEVFKKGKGIIIEADGVVIYEHLLSKAEKKTGIMEHLDPFVFDHPIHTLEFLGVKKSKIGIDNLAVNIPDGPGGDSGAIVNSYNLGGFTGGENNEGWLNDPFPGDPLQFQLEARVPEPASLILFGIGLIGLRVFMRRAISNRASRRL